MTDPSVSDLRNAAVERLHQLALLTFRQKQLLDANELTPVLNQVIRGRRTYNAIIFSLAILVLYFAAHTLTSGEIPWFSGLCSVVLATYLLQSWGQQKRAREAVLKFEATQKSGCSAKDLLLTELKLHHRQLVEQYHQLQDGNVLKVAAAVRQQTLNNGRAILICGPIVTGCLLLLEEFIAVYRGKVLDAVEIAELLAVGVVCVIAVGAVGWREFRRATRLDQLMMACHPNQNVNRSPADRVIG